MISRTVLTAAVLAFSFTSAWAAPRGYECDLTGNGKSRGWIAEKMVIAIEPNGQVIVTDGRILHYKQDPMIAKVTKNTDQNLKLRWALRNIRDGGNQLIERLNHEASLNKKTNEITVRVDVAKWPGNRFSGRGTCKPLTK